MLQSYQYCPEGHGGLGQGVGEGEGHCCLVQPITGHQELGEGGKKKNQRLALAPLGDERWKMDFQSSGYLFFFTTEARCVISCLLVHTNGAA